MHKPYIRTKEVLMSEKNRTKQLPISKQNDWVTVKQKER